MNCSNCGFTNNPESKFCIKCGNNLDSVSNESITQIPKEPINVNYDLNENTKIVNEFENQMYQHPTFESPTHLFEQQCQSQPIVQEQAQSQVIYQPTINNIKSNKPTQEHGKIKKIVLIILGFVIFLLITLGMIYYLNRDKNKNVQTNGNQLLIDYQNGIISTEQYVLYNIYKQYDKSLLEKKYQDNNKVDVAIHIEDLINENYDKLSDKTKKYYAEQINLNNITFKLNQENNDDTIDNDKVAISNLFIDTVYAKTDKTTNLNKAVLSSNGNFVVWYTTTGNSKTTYENAKKVADGLEITSQKYDSLFNKDYSYSSTVFSKGSRYKEQLKILQNENIDVSYLESAMQVYIVNYNGDSLAQYVSGYRKGKEILNSLFGGDSNGTIAFPYILIRPEGINDFERLEQVYNHELFHHYQHNILCGNKSCNLSKDGLIVEGTANWASALVTTKTNKNGFLNEWAGVARYQSNGLLGSYIEDFGSYTAGYPFYVFLNGYANNVKDGNTKIINAIYQNDPLEYLEDNCTTEEFKNVQEYISLKNLTQDYDNQNFLVSSKSPKTELYIKGILNDNFKVTDVNINKLGISYYLLDKDSTNAYEINFIRDNYYVDALMIAEDINDNYVIAESAPNTNKNYTFNTNKYGDYDKLYLVVYNKNLTLENYYSIDVKSIEKEVIKKYSSFDDCTVISDEIINKIDTYYFDEKGIAYKRIDTIYLTKDANINDTIETFKRQPNRYTDIKYENNIIQYQLSDSWFKQFYNNYDIDMLIYRYGMSCSLTCNGTDCKWENGNNEFTSDFNPEGIIQKNEVEENKEYITTFNNYNIEIKMDITISGINTNTVSKGIVDELHQKEYLDVTTTSMGLISLTNKVYHDFNSGYTYMTQPYGGDVWVKEKSAAQMVDLKKILDKLINMENVTKVSENQYKVQMSKDDIKDLMASGNASSSTISGDVYVNVYTENGYITKLEYDFTNMITGFDLFKTAIKYSNYNKAGNVEIPQSIIDNAKVQ